MKNFIINKLDSNQTLQLRGGRGGNGATYYGEICEDLSTYQEYDDEDKVTSTATDQWHCEEP